MRVVITTVHGTFAKAAEWPLAQSSLNRYLRDHLPGPVEIRPFRWSGLNGFDARETAARSLRDHLIQVNLELPESAQFVIAHSHGGNVALLAAGDESIRKMLRGVVCLSTPFLQAWPRKLGAARVINAIAGVVLVAANLLYWCLHGWIEPSMLQAALVFLSIPAMWLIGKAALRLADPSLHRWVLPTVEPDHLLILRAPADEASATLGAATLVANLTTRVWSLTTHSPRWIRNMGEDLDAGAMGLPQPNSQFEKSDAWSAPEALRHLLLGVFFIPMWWISSILVGPMLVVLFLFALFFGPSLALHHLFWIVSAEPTPPGAWLVVQLEAPESLGFQTALMHSTLYDHPRAHSVIAHWIAGRCRDSSESGAHA